MIKLVVLLIVVVSISHAKIRSKHSKWFFYNGINTTSYRKRSDRKYSQNKQEGKKTTKILKSCVILHFIYWTIFNPYPRNHALWRIWPFLAITHFHAFTVSPQSRILTQNVSLGTVQSSITRSSLITRRIEVKLVSVKSERSVLYVYNKSIVILCILYILETAKFDKQLIFARSVKFQINDVTSAHWPAYHMKTRIITKTLILQ